MRLYGNRGMCFYLVCVCVCVCESPVGLPFVRRSGEPLWAETARLLVRFILLFLFIAFVVYSIYRSVQSPVVVQEIREPTDIVRVPGTFKNRRQIDS